MAVVEEVALSSPAVEEEEQRLWTDMDACVSSSCQDHESIDDALRTWLDLTARLCGRRDDHSADSQQQQQAEEDGFISCAQVLVDSSLFRHNKDYVRTQLIHSLLQEEDATSLHAITSLLLLDGHYDGALFPRMIEEACFPRLVELLWAKGGARGEKRNPRLYRFLLQLMYEMSRVERLKPEELAVVDDEFVDSLFRNVEEVSEDVHDAYHYPTIRVLLVMNEQYMLASTASTQESESRIALLPNLVVKCLSLHGPFFHSFGENMILLLNRETETSLQLLILKLLYLLFTTKATYEYFYTNDLRVLLDVIIRNLMDLPDERVSLRHTYLRVLYPLLAHTQLSHAPHYKRDEILKLLKVLRGSQNAHFAPTDETTLRLVDRVAKVEWLLEGSSRKDGSGGGGGGGASEVARKILGMSLSPTQYASNVSVGDVAVVKEKPGVQTPSRKPKPAVPEVPRHRHGVPFAAGGQERRTVVAGVAEGKVDVMMMSEVKKTPPKAPPPRRIGRLKMAEAARAEALEEEAAAAAAAAAAHGSKVAAD